MKDVRAWRAACVAANGEMVDVGDTGRASLGFNLGLVVGKVTGVDTARSVRRRRAWSGLDRRTELPRAPWSVFQGGHFAWVARGGSDTPDRGVVPFSAASTSRRASTRGGCG